MAICGNRALMPPHYCNAHNFWNRAGCLVPIVGLALFFAAPWWIATLVIFFGLMIAPAVRKSAPENLLAYALENEAFFQLMVEQKVITFTDRFGEARKIEDGAVSYIDCAVPPADGGKSPKPLNLSKIPSELCLQIPHGRFCNHFVELNGATVSYSLSFKGREICHTCQPATVKWVAFRREIELSGILRWQQPETKLPTGIPTWQIRLCYSDVDVDFYGIARPDWFAPLVSAMRELIDNEQLDRAASPQEQKK